MADIPRRFTLPALEGTSDPDRAESTAPPEAVRAIAALLGRAATTQRKRRTTPPRPRAGSPRPASPRQRLVSPSVATSGATATSATTLRSVDVGDREVLIQGSDVSIGETSSAEVRRARKRMRRARRAVREALERLIAAAPEELTG